MKFCSFASGSSGNAYLVKTENTALLVDAGISFKRINEGLRLTGTDTEKLGALLVTHEHSDHICSLETAAKRVTGMQVHATAGTWLAIGNKVPAQQQRTVTPSEPFHVGDIKVYAVSDSHDANEPVAYSFEADGKKLTIITDTGHITSDAYSAALDADLLVLEANYEHEVLMIGRYPYFLKQRIIGPYGHLSNIDAAETIASICSENPKPRRVLLAHLSKENNHPALAEQTVRNYLENCGCCIGGELRLGILLRDSISDIYEV